MNRNWILSLSASVLACVWAGPAVAVDTTPLRAVPGVPSPAAAVHPEPGDAIRLVSLPKDVKINVWAAEPQLLNPVGFSIDERGRMYVAQTLRYKDGGVIDNRQRVSWLSEEFKKKASKERLANISNELLDREIAARTVDDRMAYIREFADVAELSKYSERVQMLEDRDGDGKAEISTVFADGWKDPLQGIASSVLARKGDIFLTNIPALWVLRDNNGDGRADTQKILSHGYGVRYAFTGHDLHGLRLGPDGRLYFSIGDRGSNVKTAEGRVLANPDTGSVFRCELDGSGLEVFATGLRNPQDLIFDEHGNLFTGDNNSDGGDKARIVYVVEGGDSGWRIGYQYIEEPVARGPWNAERMWHPAWVGQDPHLVPPIENLTNGPSGLTYYPGTGMSRGYAGQFLLADFRGQNTLSGVVSFQLKEEGAGFHLVSPDRFLWNLLVTDIDYGPDGALYVSDWLQGWQQPAKGRVFKLTHPEALKDPVVAQTRTLFANGFSRRSEPDLVTLLGHPDYRIRLEAELELVGRKAGGRLVDVAKVATAPQLPRLHAIWGLGQLVRKGDKTSREALTPVLTALLDDPDAEVRAQAARTLGDARVAAAILPLQRRLTDSAPRPRFFAAIALGNLANKDAVPALRSFVAANADSDPYLRHAGVFGLMGTADTAVLKGFASAPESAVRRAALLAMRRNHAPDVRMFLADKDPLLVRDAARAINDEAIDGATADLAQASNVAAHDVPTGLRLVNANYRVGGAEGAKRLGSLAADKTMPAEVRQAALQALGDWARPSIRDRVTGIFHAFADSGKTRDIAPAAKAVEPAMSGLLAATVPMAVRQSAIRAAGMLALKGASPALVRALTTGPKNKDGALRVAALRTLGSFRGAGLSKVIATASKDQDPLIRTEALRLQIETAPNDAFPVIESVLKRGTVREKQAAIVAGADLKDPRIDGLLASTLDLATTSPDKVAPEMWLELVESSRKRKAPLVVAKLAAFEQTRPTTEVGPYREARVGGDREEGRKVLQRHPLVQCLRCHKLGEEGADLGPDLSHVAKGRDRDYLLEAIVRPSARFARGFESVIVTMADGTVHGGMVKEETATSMKVLNPDNQVETLDKTKIKTREAGASGMPDGFADILTRRELRDLVEFMTVLK